MCQKDYERIKHWNNYEYIDKTKVWILSKEGELGMMRLGQRLKTYFPELIQCRPVNTLKKQYYVNPWKTYNQIFLSNNRNIHIDLLTLQFRAMNAQRSIASMRSLIKGLFGNINLDNVDIRNTSHDKILQVSIRYIIISYRKLRNNVRSPYIYIYKYIISSTIWPKENFSTITTRGISLYLTMNSVKWSTVFVNDTTCRAILPISFTLSV